MKRYREFLMTKTQFLTAIASFTILYCIVVYYGPQSIKFRIKEGSIVSINNLKSFTDANFNSSVDSKTLSDLYSTLRGTALAKIRKLLSYRDVLNLSFHAFTILSIFLSFYISYLGSIKGIVINDVSDTLKSKPSGLNLKFRRRLVLVSSIVILFTTLSNRSSAYSDSLQSKAYELITLTDGIDNKINSALSLNEVREILNSYELQLSKY